MTKCPHIDFYGPPESQVCGSCGMAFVGLSRRDSEEVQAAMGGIAMRRLRDRLRVCAELRDKLDKEKMNND